MSDFEFFTVTAAVLLVAEVLGVALAIDAVMGKRSSQGAIAWFIALVAVPLFTVPFYLVFGRTRFHGYGGALREAEARVGARVTDWIQRMTELAAAPRDGLESVEATVRRLTGLPFTRANSGELLIDGATTYQAMIQAIAGAESYVLVQFYIVRDDPVGRRLRDALIDRKRAGVRVYFLYDEVGCMNLPSRYLEEMSHAGIEVTGFRTTRGLRNRFQINFRNHRKLLIVDGRTGFIGGHNLGQEYLGYRDTHLRLDGPAAQQIQLTFLKDWYWATREIPEMSGAVHRAPGDGPGNDQAVAIVNTGPADIMPSCSVLYATLISAANRRVWITSPYFVPDDVMVRALQAAALRGVDVRVVLPDRADNRVVELASFTYYGDMIESGVRLYRYRDRFMHQKVILIDDGLAGIGTVNLDNRSLYLNFEATALIADRDFARQVDVMLERDLAEAEPVDLAHYERKPFWFRAAARIARLASPLL